MNEHRARIEAAIRQYLSHFEPANSTSDLRDIAVSLDNLVQVYWLTPDVEPETGEGSEAPSIDEEEFGRNAARFFDDSDLIWLADPDEGPDQDLMCTFASSELAEIANDLSRVIWEFENGAEANAIWEFRFGYQTHWGDHLYTVRHYIHGLGAW